MSYRFIAGEVEWKNKKTKGNETFVTIADLQADTGYQIKVRAECQIGSSKYSIITQIQTHSPPIASLMKSISTPIKTDQNVFELPKNETLRTNMICKVEVGKPPLKIVPHKVLMVVGATGAGKSTLINAMANYIFGVTWKDSFRFKLIVEQVQRQSQSVTREITAYTIYHMEGCHIPYSMTIIDTPGFGDTSGTKRDEEITALIKNFFSLNIIDHLDCIGFVAQAVLVRLTPTQRYIFESVLSIFGKDVANNIFMMVSFCDGQEPPIISALKAASIPHSAFFKFNNSALYADKAHSYSYDSDDDDFDEIFWRMGMQSMKKFFTALQKIESVSLVMTRNVLNQREKLKATIINKLQTALKQNLGHMDTLRQERITLMHYESEILANQNFTYQVREPYYEYTGGRN